MRRFVSRAGLKLDAALDAFGVDVTGKVCADLGCNAGGFTDCLLQRGAARVYAVDTGYGMLEWKLRQDSRVVAMERTNAMHAALPEAVSIVVIDVAWTRQKHILPAARRLLGPRPADGAMVISLIKPHYEADAGLLVKGVLPAECVPEVVERVKREAAAADLEVMCVIPSPIQGGKGNAEVLAKLVALPVV